MTGDCAMVAEVTSVTFSGSQNGKMGLMIRDNLESAFSQRAWIGIVPTESNGNLIEARADGWTVTWGGANWAKRSQGLPLPLPYWLKIERKDNVITSYTSQDGTSWSPIVSSDFGTLPSTVYIGMHVSSGNATPNTATFENLSYNGGTGGLVTTPDAPATMLASGSDKAITLRWLPSFGATAYDILRSTTSGSGYAVITSDLPADKTSYVDTTASPGTTYYYVARAKNSAGTSGNSPEFYADLPSVPLMKLSLSGGTPNDNASNSTNAASAFDDNFGSFWFNGGTTGWLQYDFGANSAQIIKRYTLVSATLIPERDPKDWQFQGSNDGSTWIPLDTQTNQTFEFRSYRRTFDIGNTTAYRYYRLNVTSNNGDGAFLHLGELGLWGDSGRVIPDGHYRIASRNSNKVMQVTGSADGAPVVQQAFDGSDNQLWEIQWQGNGKYRATHVASDKSLDNGGTSNPGENLVIQPSGGGVSQLWTLQPNADGFFSITSENSGLVADVSGGSTADGANMIQSIFTGGISQQWLPGFSIEPQQAPPGPTGVTATPASIYQVDLSWAASSGAVSYNIKRATVSGGPYTTIAMGVNTTNYADTDLLSSTTYYYVISAVNGSGEGAESVQAQATTLTGPPAAPTGLTTILGTNQVVLSWAATGGATSYSIKRATTSGGPYTTVASNLTGTAYTDTSISHTNTYHYVVVANNADGTGTDSAEVTLGAGTLVAHLKFDEVGGAIATDSSGRGQHATLLNGASFAPGVLQGGLDLPATSSQHATLPSGIVSGLTDFTFATWIKVNAFATWQRIFDFGTGMDNYMFLSTQGPAGAGRLRFSIRSSSVAEQNTDSTVALTASTWTHVAVTRSGTTVRLYINGAPAGTGTATLSPADLGFTTLNYLGKSQFTDPYLNSALDDFRLYAHALSQADLTTLANPAAGAPSRLIAAPGDTQTTLTWYPNATTTYTVKRSTTSGGPYTTVATGVTDLTYTDTGLTNGVTYYYVIGGANASGPGPDSAEVSVTPGTMKLHLKFDETYGTNAADSSGHNMSAETINSPSWTAGRIGNALGLNGTNEYVNLPSDLVSGVDDFTVATWVHWNGGANWQRIFDFGSGTSTYMFLSPKNGENGRLRFAITTSGGGGEKKIDSTAELPSGGWHHVAVTLSGSTGTLYVDGQQVGQNTAMTLRPSDLGATTQNRIGRSQYNDPYFNGRADDFRLYSGALSASDIAALASPIQTTGLAATSGAGQIALTWDSTQNATGYTVRRSPASGAAYTTVASGLTETNYTEAGLAYGVTYHYVVTPTNASGEGANSNEASGTALTPLESWRLTHFGTTANTGDAADNADPDGDGMTNAQEFTAGTDPRNAASVFRVSELAANGNGVLLSFPTVAGKTYRLERSDSMLDGSWTPVQENIPGTGAIIQLTATTSFIENSQFYRVAVSP